MKQFWRIWIILVLAALTGCVKAELDPVPEREITFTVGHYASADTKAASLESYSITSFKSKAFLHAEGYEDETQNIFGANGETISARNASGNIITSGVAASWAPSHPYYWPKSALSYINFVSWYDNGGTPTTASETRLEWTNRTITATDNIMYADVAWRFNDNYTSAAQYNGDAVTSGVTTLFHHALAQVKFQARLSEASEGNTSWTVTVSNFRLTNVHNTGSLVLYNSDPTTAFTTRPWTNAAGTGAPVWTQTDAVETISLNGSHTLGAANQVLMDFRSVLPQSTFGMQLTFDYTINTTYGTQGNPISSMSENAQATVDLYSAFMLYTWDMNTRYTYTLVINPKTNKITFEPTLTEGWNSDTGNSMFLE